MDELRSLRPDLKLTGIRRLKFKRQLLPGESFRWMYACEHSNRLILRAWVGEQALLDAQMIIDT